jgi:hypothetical protein
MKNIHLIPTDKSSRLYRSLNSGLYYHKEIVIDMDIRGKNQNIYITSDEEIKEGDYFLLKNNIYKASNSSLNNPLNPMPNYFQKIILTTDQDLIKDGVQFIDDEFLEWFVKNPSCEEVETKLVEFEVDMGLGEECIEYSSYYKIIIPKEEPKQECTITKIMQMDAEIAYKSLPKQETLEQIDQTNPVTRGSTALVSKQETLEETAEIWVHNRFTKQIKDENIYASESNIVQSHILFAKWQQERSYSEEEVLNILDIMLSEYRDSLENKTDFYPASRFEKFKKK